MHCRTKIIIAFLSFGVLAQERIIYKYKKNESIDLGELSIKGNIVSPGDLSAKERETRLIQFNIPLRYDVDDFLSNDLDLIN